MKGQIKIRSGFSCVDDSIGGFPLGCVNVITGKAASGKSTLVRQMCVTETLMQGYDVFVFDGECHAPYLKDNVELNIASMDNKCNNLQDVKDHYGSQVLYFDKDNCTMKSLLSKMRDIAHKQNTKVFIIDSLGNISERTNAILKLSDFAKESNVLVHVVVPIYLMDEVGLTDYTTTIYRYNPDEKKFVNCDCVINFERRAIAVDAMHYPAVHRIKECCMV